MVKQESEDTRASTRRIVADGVSNPDRVESCGRPRPVGVAVCQREGHTEEFARKPGRLSVDTATVSEIPDMQWCFPFRRQQEGAPAPVAAKAIGANQLKAITESTRLATKRRMLSVNANTSLAAVTNSPTRR